MQEYFYTLADRLERMIQGNEVLTCYFEAERSDFVRLNHNLIGQAGSVEQRELHIDLIEGRRHAAGSCSLTGDTGEDAGRLRDLVSTLREQRSRLEPDPHLLYATEVHSTEEVDSQPAPDSDYVLQCFSELAEGLDLVGILANGCLFRGFANSLGQRNWYCRSGFNLDWSCHAEADKAVKCGYAGFDFDPLELERKITEAREQLQVLRRPPLAIAPGGYRAYLAPAAMRDVLEMMAWGGFDLKSHRTAQTPLIRMVRDGQRLSPLVTLDEDQTQGMAPRFTEHGFVKAARVRLIEAGAYGECLVGPRSGCEYGVAVNAGGEFPESLAMAGGGLPGDAVLERLGTGLLINNFWYCNFSDRNHCRITGMTRYACFWVENATIRAPVCVMRFDDTVYRMLGEALVDLTTETQLIPDSETYEQRSTASMRVPGALISDLNLTL